SAASTSSSAGSRCDSSAGRRSTTPAPPPPPALTTAGSGSTGRTCPWPSPRRSPCGSTAAAPSGRSPSGPGSSGRSSSRSSPQGAGPLQLMYGIDGRSELDEFELPHLEGYRGSRPVRVGNGAHGQLQMDVYGELMDAVYLFNKYAAPVGYDDWVRLRGMVDWV